MFRIREIGKTLVLVVALTLWLSLAPTTQASSEIFYHALRSTGWVVTSKSDGKAGVATCSVIDQQRRLVITNHHVIRDGGVIRIFFPEYQRDRLLTSTVFYQQPERGIRARVVNSDPRRDLALLQLDRLPRNVVALALAREPVHSGQVVHTIGNSGTSGKPLDRGVLWKYRTSEVAKLFFTVKMMDGQQRLESRVIETKLGVRPGDSGGPLLNDEGELVGVVAAYSIENPSLDYSIDLSELREFVARTERPQRPAVPVHGSWTLNFQAKGHEKFLSLTLRPDGSCILDGDRAMKGSYRYSANQLTLVVPELNINDQVALAWDNADHFRFQSRGIAFEGRRR